MTPPQEQPRAVEGKCRQFGTSGPCFDCISFTGCGFNTPAPDYRAKWEEAERLLRKVRDCRVPAKRTETMDGELDRPEAWALNKLTALLPDIDAFLGDKSNG